MDRVNISRFLREKLFLPENYILRGFPEESHEDAQADFKVLDHPKKLIDFFSRIQEFKQLNKEGVKVVSSVHGKIQALLLTFPNYKSDDYNLPFDIVCNLIQQLDKDVEIYLISVVEEDDLTAPVEQQQAYVRDLLSLLRQGGAHRVFFYSAENNDKYSAWVRDPFLISEVENTATLLEPHSFSRLSLSSCSDMSNQNPTFFNSMTSDDEGLADSVINGGPIFNKGPIKLNHIKTPLTFHGGNTLIGDDFILVGADFFDAEKEKVKAAFRMMSDNFGNINDNWIVENFQEYLTTARGKKIIKLGKPEPDDLDVCSPIKHKGIWYKGDWLFLGAQQPFFHLDLFVTLLGSAPNSRDYDVFIPLIRNASGESIEELYGQIINPWNCWLEDIANQLRDKGFKIHYIEAPLTYFTKGDTRYWCVFTYHNCLVEVTDEHRKVWMPTFGGVSRDTDKIVFSDHLAYFDFRAKYQFKKAGILVKPLMNYVAPMLLGGAVHCITNYLSRAESAESLS